MAETIVLQLSSRDGQRGLKIVQLASGMYRFTESMLQTAPDQTGAYPVISYSSGLYHSLADADTDARQHLPWVGDLDQG